MRQFDLVAPCHFGLEAVLKREIQDLGYEITHVEDGRVTFTGDEAAIALSNVFLRTTERILLQVGYFKATSFEELFEGCKALPWEEYIPRDGRFWVTKASSKNSQLFSSSDIQSIVKKAIVEKLKATYPVERFPETGQDYPIRVFINKDMVSIGLDTSGVSLRKRGYRQLVSQAPLSETLAAALIMLTPWNKDRILVDPMCGCGTIPIEAALIGANIAPGINREFTAMKWENIVPMRYFQDAKEEAQDMIRTDVKLSIQGYDIDHSIIKSAMANAKMAGVDQHIHFQQRSIAELSHPKKYGFIITNPPYGERIFEEDELPALYKMIGKSFDNMETWSKYVITSYEDAEKYLGKKATKNRKIYNGMLKTYFYQFLGPKPPRQDKK